MIVRTRVRAVALFVLSALSALSLSTNSSAGALQPNGTATGKVYECPGNADNRPIPPTHASVALIRNQRTWDTQLITFSRKTFSGSFALTAPAGRYEVVVAIPGYPVRWIKLTSGDHKRVDFGVIACPA